MHRRATPLLAVAILLGACGGGGAPAATTPPSPTGVGATAYVSGVCGALLTWGDSLKSRTDALPSQLSSIKTLEDGKRIFTDYLDGVVQETNTMVGTVQNLGAPAVANGQALQRAVNDALHTIQSAIVDAETKAKALPTDNPTAFAQGAEAIGSSVEAQISGVGDKLDALKSEELTKAAEADPTCQKLNSL
jgi:hypothetical protein